MLPVIDQVRGMQLGGLANSAATPYRRRAIKAAPRMAGSQDGFTHALVRASAAASARATASRLCPHRRNVLAPALRLPAHRYRLAAPDAQDALQGFLAGCGRPDASIRRGRASMRSCASASITGTRPAAQSVSKRGGHTEQIPSTLPAVH
jgi:hypothetical protein